MGWLVRSGFRGGSIGQLEDPPVLHSSHPDMNGGATIDAGPLNVAVSVGGWSPYLCLQLREPTFITAGQAYRVEGETGEPAE
ncbi:hypothetical protein [Actinoplanes philippinensis]|uniref:hypothetical protein n=1 Tax=Actinoplanes philippinensis TaxID=35752 RepID=UPI0033C4A11E